MTKKLLIPLTKTILLIMISIVFFAFSCSTEKLDKPEAGRFTNPILAGFYPDPSICKVAGDYYLVNSTFSYFPGIPVFHSKDLVNWKLIGHAMERPEQMDLTGLGVSRGIFAPAISYNEGLYYITCTLVDAGGNFVVTAKSPEGPWSNPTWIPEIDGIDPSLFFDENGKAYILYNSIPPDNKPLYDGHRTIRMYKFDLENLRVSGEEKIVVNGGTDISKEPVWIEAPHIYKVNNYYYLMCAEGGTADQHSEVIFRSEKVNGPYVPYDNNPILTQRHLDPKREHAITSTGHADMVQTDSGDWWAVFLGCRPYPPYEKGYYNTGRETFLAPVKWIDGWPIINPEHELVQYNYPLPVQPVHETGDTPYSGNFTSRYEFDQDKLHPNWIYLRTPHENWHNLDKEKGLLALQLRPETCSGKNNPSFLGHRQQHLACSAATSFMFTPATENEKAGLLVFLNENRFYFLCKSLENGEPVIQLYKSVDTEIANNNMELIISAKISSEQAGKKLNVKIEAAGKYYSCYYAIENDEWISLKKNMDAVYLRAVIPRDFVGCVFALYATSLGKESSNTAYFDWFEYQGNDNIYNF